MNKHYVNFPIVGGNYRKGGKHSLDLSPRLPEGGLRHRREVDSRGC